MKKRLHCFSYLSAGRVDADGGVKVLLGRSTFHGGTKALSHLPCVWPQVVEPDYTVLKGDSENNKLSGQNSGERRRNLLKPYAVQFVADDLGVALVVVAAWHSVLQRPEQTVVHLLYKNLRQTRMWRH